MLKHLHRIILTICFTCLIAFNPNAQAKNDLIAIVPKGDNNEIEKKIVMSDIKKEYKEGEIVGKCEAYSGENKIGEVELYSDRDIKLGGIFENFKFNMKNMFRKGI